MPTVPAQLERRGVRGVSPEVEVGVGLPDWAMLASFLPLAQSRLCLQRYPASRVSSSYPRDIKCMKSASQNTRDLDSF